MLNNCTFIGTLGRDPEAKQTQNSMIASFSLAVTEKWKDKSGEKKEDTQWINCVAFGNLAKVLTDYAGKGQKLYVETKFKLEKYTGKDGAEKQSAKFIVIKLVLLGGGKSSNTSKPSPQIELDDDIPF